MALLTSIASRLLQTARILEQRAWIALNLRPAYNYDLQPTDHALTSLDDQPDDVDNDHGILWMAVPKKRTSRRKKRLRNLNKQLKPIRNFEHCNVCGNLKLTSIFCSHCLRRIKEETKAYRKSLKPLKFKL
ncbi:putative 54S ribosomal protein L32, mitochondrial [Trichoplax sp. H2]|nr:putative 54S ribosomal protein L32, mitochondrial [Trichoplax sp. H2]|eukprot:RDD38475.1 putative 54S ribosomal protein L32, mitochondrial [Trichoplax sp. H2]